MYTTVKTKDFKGYFQVEVVDSEDWPVLITQRRDGFAQMPTTMISLNREELEELLREGEIALQELDSKEDKK